MGHNDYKILDGNDGLSTRMKVFLFLVLAAAGLACLFAGLGWSKSAHNHKEIHRLSNAQDEQAELSNCLMLYTLDQLLSPYISIGDLNMTECEEKYPIIYAVRRRIQEAKRNEGADSPVITDSKPEAGIEIAEEHKSEKSKNHGKQLREMYAEMKEARGHGNNNPGHGPSEHSRIWDLLDYLVSSRQEEHDELLDFLTEIGDKLMDHHNEVDGEHTDIINILSYVNMSIHNIYGQLEDHSGICERLAEYLELTLGTIYWPMWTRTPNGWTYISNEDTKITRTSVATLDHKCDLPYDDLKVPPSPVFAEGNNHPGAIYKEYIIMNSRGTGSLQAYNRTDCSLIWSVDIGQLFQDHVPVEIGSTAPINASISYIAVRNQVIYITPQGFPRVMFVAPSERFFCNTNGNPFCQNISNYLMSLDLVTGAYDWHLKLTDNSIPEDFFAHVAAPPTISNHVAYIGTASFANVFTDFGLTCTYVGQFMAVDLVTRTLKWSTRTLPTGTGPGGWCGGSVWSRPAISEELGLVFIGTGNGHYQPLDVDNCLRGGYPYPHSQYGLRMRSCHTTAKATYNHPILTSSVAALNIHTGDFEWTYSPYGLDVWQPGCLQFGANVTRSGVPGIGCHGFNGPDWDFGGNLVLVGSGVDTKIIAGSKSGDVFAFRATHGDLLWSVKLTTGVTFGGTHWSGSYNPVHDLVYFTTSSYLAENLLGLEFDLMTLSGFYYYERYADRVAGGAYVCGAGGVHAIDPKTGHVVRRFYDQSGLIDRVSGTGALLPPECTARLVPDIYDFTSSAMVDTVEVFKNGLSYLDASGNPNIPGNTATLGLECAGPLYGDPTAVGNFTFSRMHGAATVTDDLVFAGSFTGTLYALEADTLNCVRTLGCDQGAIYGHPSIYDDQLFVSCGYSYQGQVQSADHAVLWELNP